MSARSSSAGPSKKRPAAKGSSPGEKKPRRSGTAAKSFLPSPEAAAALELRILQCKRREIPRELCLSPFRKSLRTQMDERKAWDDVKMPKRDFSLPNKPYAELSEECEQWLGYTIGEEIGPGIVLPGPDHCEDPNCTVEARGIGEMAIFPNNRSPSKGGHQFNAANIAEHPCLKINVPNCYIYCRPMGRVHWCYDKKTRKRTNNCTNSTHSHVTKHTAFFWRQRTKGKTTTPTPRSSEEASAAGTPA
jgi:hypothetical protein